MALEFTLKKLKIMEILKLQVVVGKNKEIDKT
jgi:hypothetical protein